MKNAIAILMLSLATMSASAMDLAGYDSSLQYLVSWPQVVMSNLSVPVKNICSEGSTLKTVAPVTYCSVPAVVQVCTKLSNHGETECRDVLPGETPVQAPGVQLIWGCAKTASAMFETTKSYQAPVCTQWEQQNSGSHNTIVNVCVKFGTETKIYPDSYTVSVLQMSTSGNRGWNEVAALPFTIPACK